jgi:16S rRNA (cytidine1402-2'-O)-methyltransferase
LSEDTRHSRKLLATYGIDTTLEPLHDHNEDRIAHRVVTRLKEKREACALISDAGTPLISDPGFTLVAGAIEALIPVLAVPGPCAVTAGLSVAGLPTNRFAFEGFLPSRAQARARRLDELRRDPRTLVFYEAPHRILDTLASMVATFGENRDAAVARELTKKFESLYRGQLGSLLERIKADPNATRGEFVIMIGGHDMKPEVAEAERIMAILLDEVDKRTAIRVAAAITGMRRNELYGAMLRGRAADDDVEI